MKRLLSAAALVCLALTGCGSAPTAPVSQEIAGLKHDVILSTDDEAVRAGANPTYALFEFRAATKSYRLLALSKKFIPLTRTNQEELYFTKDLTNVVASWGATNVFFDRNAATGERSNYIFRPIPTRPAPGEVAYPLDRSRLAVHRVLTTGLSDFFVLDERELNRLLNDTGAIGEIRAWLAGTKQYPAVGPVVTPIRISELVLAITPAMGGENARFYFVPDSALSTRHEVIEDGAALEVHWVEGFMTNKSAPFTDLSFVRFESASSPRPGENFACEQAFMTIGAGVLNQRNRFCGYNAPGLQWNVPVYAKSPDMGVEQVLEFTGTRYDKNGKLFSKTTLNLGFNGFYEYRAYTGTEAAKLLATFTR